MPTLHKVPNQFPTSTGLPYRLAIIGEAPGLDEASWGECLACHYEFAKVYKLPDKSPEVLQECTLCPNCRRPLTETSFVSRPTPFIGVSGNLLNEQLSRVNLLRKACFVGNVVQHRPPGNNIKSFAKDGPEFVSGREALIRDLATFKPNLCLGLGNIALEFLKGHKESIDHWRGSLFTTDVVPTLPGLKCLTTIHPASILRTYSDMPLFKFDLHKAAVQATTPSFERPRRNLQVYITEEEILARLKHIHANRIPISVDIEGRIDTMYCLSIATSPTEAFIIPTTNQFWSAANEFRFWRVFSALMADPAVPKIFQNCLYDLFVLKWSYGIDVNGVVHDTMLLHWEVYSELQKSLGFQASIYTNEPYWKDDREHDSLHVRHEYCCRDSAVTLECLDRTKAHAEKVKASFDHYSFNLKLLEPILFMELRGITYDKTKANNKLSECERSVYRLQWALNTIAGFNAKRSRPDWLQTFYTRYRRVQSRLPTRPEELQTACKKEAEPYIERFSQIYYKDGELTLADHGELSMLCGAHLNVSATETVQSYLYETLKLPKQYKKVGGRLTDKSTTDQLALLHLWKKTHDPALQIILKIRAILARSKALAAETDADGRIRGAYNVVGSETGRVTCYASPTGSGFNLQTATKRDRDLFCADPGYWFFQCDLSGADGWTVAAHCAACGDRIMLDDYLYGLKPARIIALLYLHGDPVLSWSRERLKAESEKIDSDGWLYFACKRVQHGSNYGMGARTMVDQILKDSYKLFGDPILLEEVVCQRLQNFYFKRYTGIKSWHAKSQKQLWDHGYLVSANGHKRIFFGRRRDYNTFKEFLAEEPQQNTTYVTNNALLQCWTDPENRVASPAFDSRPASFQKHLATLRIQPLHQVHDAFIGQWRQEDTAWACGKIRQWFSNPITIAGQTITIPFEGAYGKSWGDLHEGVI